MSRGSEGGEWGFASLIAGGSAAKGTHLRGRCGTNALPAHRGGEAGGEASQPVVGGAAASANVWRGVAQRAVKVTSHKGISCASMHEADARAPAAGCKANCPLPLASVALMNRLAACTATEPGPDLTHVPHPCTAARPNKPATCQPFEIRPSFDIDLVVYVTYGLGSDPQLAADFCMCHAEARLREAGWTRAPSRTFRWVLEGCLFISGWGCA
jgi:hypothetical protein